MTPDGRRRLIEQTVADLGWLAEVFADFGGTEHDLRRASPIVRRLLVDGGLQQARVAAGIKGQPRFEIFPLTQAVDFHNLGPVKLALAMGCSVRGRSHGPFVVTQPGHLSHRSTPARMVRNDLRLSDFLRSTCAVVAGLQLSRHDLIKYVANRDGGAHHGGRQQKPETERAFSAFESNEVLLRVGEFPPVYLDFLAIVQATVASPSVMDAFGLAVAPSPLYDVPTGSSAKTMTRPARSGLALDLGTSAPGVLRDKGQANGSES